MFRIWMLRRLIILKELTVCFQHVNKSEIDRSVRALLSFGPKFALERDYVVVQLQYCDIMIADYRLPLLNGQMLRESFVDMEEEVWKNKVY